jgi:AcrR family transcriptional regulator
VPRRSRLSRDERRQRLLEVAQAVFGEKGYRKTEVEELARRAGVTKPVIYRHFPGGKAEIYRRVLDEHLAVLLSGFWQAIGSSHEPQEALRRGVGAYLSFAENNPDAFHLLVDASPELDAGIGDRLAEVRSTIATELSQAIARVLVASDLPSEGAPIYAHALLGGVESVVEWWLRSGRPERERVVEYLVAFAWRGFDGLPRDAARLQLHPLRAVES